MPGRPGAMSQQLDQLGGRIEEACEWAGIEVVSWAAIADDFLDAWEQAEQLIVLGKTGRGKTTFVTDILDRRHEYKGSSICVFVTKKRDNTSSELFARGDWHHITEWPPKYHQRKAGKLILWPPYTKPSTYPRDVRPTFLAALDEIMEEGNWTLYLDEASYMVESLKLRVSLDEFFTQSRSNAITLLAGSQRPVWVSRSALSQHAWVCSFRIGDSDDAARAGEVIGNKKRFAPVIEALGPHQFLLVNTLTDEGYVTQIGT
jgi:hypothetical protein